MTTHASTRASDGSVRGSVTTLRFEPRLWEAMSGRAGKWRVAHDPVLYLPPALRALTHRRCVYVPLRQHLHGYRIDYVGSAVRRTSTAAWQRVVSEHQRKHLDRLRDWARVAVIGLRDDTPVRAVRMIEAAVADLVGCPPRCVVLPTLPTDWRTQLADMAPEEAEQVIT